MHKHLLALIRYSLGGQLESCLTDGTINWRDVLEEAKQQTVAGITYVGVEKISKLDTRSPGQWTTESIARQSKSKNGSKCVNDIKPSIPILLDWIAEARKNEKRNKELDKQCSQLCELFTKNSFHNCIIKGQGVAQLYNEFSIYRTPGDIDIWVNGNRNDIIQFVRSKIGEKRVDICKKHIEMPIINGTIVEVHFTPSILNSPIANRRLHKFFSEQSDECFNNRITTAEGQTFTSANVCLDSIQILIHILEHFLYEGIGFRQIIDYYFVLKVLHDTSKSQLTTHNLNRLGLKHFTEALMWVLHEILGLPEEYLITSQNERYGKILLDEILKGGNFGKSSALAKDTKHTKALWRFFKHTKRQLHFLRIVPSEIIWSPYRRIETYLWRRNNGYIK